MDTRGLMEVKIWTKWCKTIQWINGIQACGVEQQLVQQVVSVKPQLVTEGKERTGSAVGDEDVETQLTTEGKNRTGSGVGEDVETDVFLAEQVKVGQCQEYIERDGPLEELEGQLVLRHEEVRQGRQQQGHVEQGDLLAQVVSEALEDTTEHEYQPPFDDNYYRSETSAVQNNATIAPEQNVQSSHYELETTNDARTLVSFSQVSKSTDGDQSQQKSTPAPPQQLTNEDFINQMASQLEFAPPPTPLRLHSIRSASLATLKSTSSVRSNQETQSRPNSPPPRPSQLAKEDSRNSSSSINTPKMISLDELDITEKPSAVNKLHGVRPLSPEIEKASNSTGSGGVKRKHPDIQQKKSTETPQE